MPPLLFISPNACSTSPDSSALRGYHSSPPCAPHLDTALLWLALAVT